MKILFEDDDLVAVQKPAGYLSVPSSMGKNDPRPVAGIELQNQLQVTLFPLHRLDLEVEGVLAFAKNTKAQVRISKLWDSGKVQKTYRALTYTRDFFHWPEGIEGKSEGDLGASPWTSLLVAGKRRAFVAAHGLKSITNWKIISENKTEIEWELEPVTGRRHQLRIELSRHGFPILGDHLYGSKIRGPENEIALKAIRLKIEGYDLIEAQWSWDSWKQK
jgi:tRNA pseudouridine32 synthase/23S rRNA pseudouridine746 synthase